METSVAISVTPKIGWLIPMIKTHEIHHEFCHTISEMVQPRFRWKTKQTMAFFYQKYLRFAKKTFENPLGESALWWYQQQNLYWNICFIKRWVAARCTSHSWCWTSQNWSDLHLGESLQVHNQSLLPVFTQINDLGLGIISTLDRRFSWAVAFSRCTHQGEPRWTPHRFDPFWSAVAVPTKRVAAEKHGGAWWPMRWISAKP